MVAPLALPLVGLLAAGAGMALKPHYENYAAKTRGKYREGLLADVDHSDPDALGLSLFKGGLLDTKDFQADVRTAFEGVQDRANAIRRQKIASGPAYMNAQLAREKFNLENKLVADEEVYWRSIIAEHGTDQEKALINNPHATPQSVKGVFGNVQTRVFGQSNTEVANQTALENAEAIGGDRGATFGALTPEARSSVVQLEQQVEDVSEAVDYFSDANLLERLATDKGTAARLATQFRDAAVSFQQKYKEAGALQAADLEFFDSIIGDPTKLAQLSSAELQRIQRTANVMKETLRSQTDIYPGLYSTPQGQQYLQGVTQPYTFATVPDTGLNLETVPPSGASVRKKTQPNFTFSDFGGP